MSLAAKRSSGISTSARHVAVPWRASAAATPFFVITRSVFVRSRCRPDCDHDANR
jgi:hypothetical protein